MRTKTLVFVSIAGFGFAVWLARGGDTPSHASVDVPAAPSSAPVAVSHAFPTSHPIAAASTPSDGARPANKLDPKSARYAKRMDDQIPIKLYNEAAQCYKGGLPPDERLDLHSRIHVRNSVVKLSDIENEETTTLTDTTLERCIRGRLTRLSWRDEQLPDLDEEGDLYMRARGWQAYLANADADDDTSGGGAIN
jgi:hypothetical protein